MSSGSGAVSRHVCAATPTMHGVRGSTLTNESAPRGMHPSLRLPDRLAFLGERLRPFLGVLGLEDVARNLRFLLERRAQLLAEPLENVGRGGRVGAVGNCLPKLADRRAQLLGHV